MDMSGFDVILRMDWLTAHRVVINCDRRRVTAYTRDGIRVMFQGDKHDALPQAVYDSMWHGQLTSWLAGLNLENEVRKDLSLLQVVCEYEDVFLEELLGLPCRDVNLTIELHPGMAPISMTPHRMAYAELQELKVQLKELLDKGFIRSSTSPWGTSVLCKAEHQRLKGLLQPLEVAKWKWEHVTMDFMTYLPRTSQGHDTMWVIVDRLTKSTHFLSV